MVHLIQIDTLQIELTRKMIKSIRLSINSSTGRIKISAPYLLPTYYIRRFVRTKMSWIQKHIRLVDSHHTGHTYTYEDGEKHMFAGKEYTLSIKIADSLCVSYDDAHIYINIPVDKIDDIVIKKRAIDNRYRQYLCEHIPRLVDNRSPRMGVVCNERKIKNMKTKRGTCNIVAKRIRLNLQLAKFDPMCLEYVVVHELTHLLERYHNKRFHTFMDQFLPDRKKRKKLLNQGGQRSQIGEC